MYLEIVNSHLNLIYKKFSNFFQAFKLKKTEILKFLNKKTDFAWRARTLSIKWTYKFVKVKIMIWRPCLKIKYIIHIIFLNNYQKYKLFIWPIILKILIFVIKIVYETNKSIFSLLANAYHLFSAIVIFFIRNIQWKLKIFK